MAGKTKLPVSQGLDAVLTWHPDAQNQARGGSTTAMDSLVFEFSGKTAHAAADPWNGRSAVAALEFFTTGLNRMREFVKPTVRMHYSILNGGDVPNVVPAYAKLWCWLRDSKGAGVEQLLGRARRIAAPSPPRTTSSAASCSRSRRTWTAPTAIASRSCASARGG